MELAPKDRLFNLALHPENLQVFADYEVEIARADGGLVWRDEDSAATRSDRSSSPCRAASCPPGSTTPGSGGSTGSSAGCWANTVCASWRRPEGGEPSLRIPDFLSLLSFALLAACRDPAPSRAGWSFFARRASPGAHSRRHGRGHPRRRRNPRLSPRSSSRPFADLAVDQRGIDVVLRLTAPDGRAFPKVDSPNGEHGPRRSPCWVRRVLSAWKSAHRTRRSRQAAMPCWCGPCGQPRMTTAPGWKPSASLPARRDCAGRATAPRYRPRRRQRSDAPPASAPGRRAQEDRGRPLRSRHGAYQALSKLRRQPLGGPGRLPECARARPRVGLRLGRSPGPPQPGRVGGVPGMGRKALASYDRALTSGESSAYRVKRAGPW